MERPVLKVPTMKSPLMEHIILVAGPLRVQYRTSHLSDESERTNRRLIDVVARG